VRNLDLVPYEPGSCTAEDTEDTEDTEKCKREKQNIWFRYKGRLVTRESQKAKRKETGIIRKNKTMDLFLPQRTQRGVIVKSGV
jgi:hypothetical protein